MALVLLAPRLYECSSSSCLYLSPKYWSSVQTYSRPPHSHLHLFNMIPHAVRSNVPPIIHTCVSYATVYSPPPSFRHLCIHLNLTSKT